MISIFEKSNFELLENDYKDLEIFKRENVILISMKKNKHDKKAFRQASNHLDAGMIDELQAVLKAYGSDNNIKAIILSSSHKVAFSRGAKIEILMGASTEQCRNFIQGGQDLLLEIQRYPKPVIAAITGLTLGGGLELVLGCDYRICSTRENVIFGAPEASLGIIPGMGGTQNLPRLIDRKKAFNIISEARTDITPEEAKELGLVDSTAPPNELVEEAFKLASKDNLKKTYKVQEIESGLTNSKILTEIEAFLEKQTIICNPDDAAAPLSKALATFIFENTSADNYSDGLRYEREVLCYLQKTADCQEGLKALTEERPAVFQGK